MPEYHVDRSIQINASPEKVFDAVADYSTWTTWSPWLIADPEADVTVTEDASSVGSVYAWNGSVTGQGECEHQQLDRGVRIDDEIRFFKPFKSVAKVAFDFEPIGDGTRVTWYMDGAMPFFMGWMIPMMKTFIGMDYTRGLKMLKEWLETGNIKSQSDFKGVVTLGPLRIAGIRQVTTLDNCADAMCTAFSEATEKLTAAGIPTDGKGASVYHHFDTKTGTFDFSAGFVIPDSTGEVPAGMTDWATPPVDAFCVSHTGSYQHLGNPWSAANQIVRYRKLKQSKIGAVEIYQNHPDDTPEAELVTEIYLPLRKKILGIF